MSDDVSGIELDALAELAHDPGWGLVQERVRLMIERKRDDLERERESDKAAEIRGYLAALREVLRLPDVLKTEIERKTTP